MTYPLMLIVPINVSINKHVYGRIVGIDFGTQTIERLFCVSSLHCENATLQTHMHSMESWNYGIIAN